MSAENPYDPPGASSTPAIAARPLLLSGFATVFVSAMVGGLVGLGLGAALGAWVPDYYRSVFSGGRDPSFDPLAVGVGQGITQGVAGGSLVGVALVALHQWFAMRRGDSRFSAEP